MNTELRDRLERFALTVQEEKPNPPPDSARPPLCPECEGRGLVRYAVPVGHELWGKMHVCPAKGCAAAAEYRALQHQGALKRAGLPDKYKKLNFATWRKLPKALKVGKETAAACAYLFAQGGFFGGDEIGALIGAPVQAPARAWVVLQGDLGTGKTGLAAAALSQMGDNGRSCLFYRVQEMFTDIQSRYGKERYEIADGLSADELLLKIQNAPALMLDECNLPSVSADKARLMEEIIRHRHARELPTLFTCNVDPRGFAQQWGERAADVVIELAHWVALKGEKIRAGVSVL